MIAVFEKAGWYSMQGFGLFCKNNLKKGRYEKSCDTYDLKKPRKKLSRDTSNQKDIKRQRRVIQ